MTKKLDPYTNHRSDSFAPPEKYVTEKSIGYCYPTSPRANYFGAPEGGYFVDFNGGNAHTGIFSTLEEAEKYCEDRYPKARWGYYSKRVDKEKQECLKPFLKENA